MTVQKTYNKNILTANGLSVSWPFTFELLNGNHLHLYVTTPEGLTTGPLASNLYAVDLQNKCVNYPLATIDPVTLQSVPPVPVQSGYKVTLIRATPLTQLTDLANGGTFNAEVLESTYDQQAMMIQDAFEKLDRATLADVSATGSYQLPAPLAQTLIGWNPDGDGLINYSPAALRGSGDALIEYLEINSTNPLTVTQAGKQINLTNEGSITLTLPPAADSTGLHYQFTQTGPGSTTIQGQETIGGVVETEDAVYIKDLVAGVDVYTRILTTGATHRVTYDQWYDVTPLYISGVEYDHGVGMNGKNYDGVSTLPAPAITLNKNLAGFIRLRATIGKDSEQPNIGSPQFEVGIDGVSPFLLPAQVYADGTEIDLDLSTWTTGNTLVIKVKRGATDTVYGVWGDLRLIRSITTGQGTTYEQIDDHDSITLTEGQSVQLFSDGASWHSVTEGSTAIPYQTIVQSKTLTADDQGIINIATDAATSLTLPQAANCEGVWYYMNQTGTGTVTLNGTYSIAEQSKYADQLVVGTDVIASVGASGNDGWAGFNQWENATSLRLTNLVQSHALGFKAYNTYSGTGAGVWQLSGNLKGFKRLTAKFGIDSARGSGNFNFTINAESLSGWVPLYSVSGNGSIQDTTIDVSTVAWPATARRLLFTFTASNYYSYCYGVLADIKLYYDAIDDQDWINDAHSLTFEKATPVTIYSDGAKWQAVVQNVSSSDHGALGGLADDDHAQYLNAARHATTDHSAATGINNHTHAQSAITNLTTDLAGKAATVHAHAIADTTGLQTALDAKVASGAVGVTVASLTDGKVPAAQLPESITGSLLYKGLWDCSGGVYPANPARGDYYVVGVGGTVSGVVFAVHDWMVYNGGAWDKIDNQSTVASVNGEIGAVVLDYTDVGAAAAGHGHAHADLTLLDADDHTQYLNETRHDLLDHSGLTGVLADHGALTGLADDDHAQYHNDSRHALIDHTGLPGCGGEGGGTLNHSALYNLTVDDHPQYLDEARHYNADHTGAAGIPSIAGLLDETAHDLLDHAGLTGIPSVAGLLNESTHDVLDHSGLTGIPSVVGLLDESAHDSLDHSGLTGIPSVAGLLDHTGHDALDHAGLTGIPSVAGLLNESAHDVLDHTGLTGCGGATDHGALTGLVDDDHTQYLNETRHDLLDHTGLTGVGGGTSTYTHTQGSAATTWTVTHNLNDYPLVHVLDDTQDVIEGTVTYVSVNQLTIEFSVAVAGTAKCFK